MCGLPRGIRSFPGEGAGNLQGDHDEDRSCLRDNQGRKKSLRFGIGGVISISPMRLFFLFVLLAAGVVHGKPVSFNRDVRPILSDKCFNCHGPDAGTREAGLRLDVREEAVAERDGVRAIVPGKPGESDAIVRVFSHDRDEQMPPPKSKLLQLSPAEREVLRAWVEQGAHYEPHWAWVPPPAVLPLPDVMDASWLRGDLDRFVLERLEAEGLAPAPEASRERWLRRVTFDLSGLPPTQQELDLFLADTDPAAHERVADRLLASPKFGERMAASWLDAARYADSFGYQSDEETHAWPYRDWVVRTFNENLPWDQFITWQLAGDLLPGATRDQRLATAFNRIHRKTQEGGSVEEEFRQDGISDRVHTVGMAFLGLTFECARCHDHKYDPISQRDYYALGAFFNSIDEHGLLHGNGSIQPQPALLLPSAAEESLIAERARGIVVAEEALEAVRAQREAAFQDWLAKPADAGVTRDLVVELACDAAEGGKLPNTASGGAAASLGGNALAPGRTGLGVLFTGDDELKLAPLPVGHMHAAFTAAFWIKPADVTGRAVILHNTNSPDINYNGFDLRLEQGRLRWMLSREWPGNAIAVETTAAIPAQAWTHVAVSCDGSARAAGLRVWINSEPAPVQVLRDQLTRDVLASGEIRLGARSRDTGLRGGMIDSVVIYSRAITPAEVSALYGGELARSRDFYFSTIDEEVRAATVKVSDARQLWREALAGVREVPVMAEMTQARPTFLLARGEYGAPQGEPVPRGVPAALPPFPAEASRDRLGLAQWLTQSNHPLTARVLMNRLWQEFWGRGLVSTPENFGLQGQPPSHPELLDWLARDFIAHGWDHKRACRTIVLSAAYRQDSRASSTLRLRDPENVLLARGPVKRLSAEQLRDNGLALAGLLRPDLGGPPVKPYQPEGSMWNALNNFLPEYKVDAGSSLYRRSLYTFWRRTTPPPNMMILDAPGKDVCAARRTLTSTPLQPLVLMNDPQFVEAARGLGERMLRDGGATAAEKVRWLFREAIGRAPTAWEVPELEALYAGQLADFAAEPARAERLLKVGEHVPPAGFSAVDLAAAATTANALLNLDAALVLR